MAHRHIGVIVGDLDLPDGWEARCRGWADVGGFDLVVARASGEVELADAAAALAGGADADVSGVLLAPGSLAGSARVADAVAGLREAGTRVVAVEPDDLGEQRLLVHQVCDRVIHGRGRWQTWRWAIAHAAAWARSPAGVHPYGTGRPSQVGDLRLPAGDGPHPVVVLLHGGFWLDPWERDLMDGLAVALTGAGQATWNLEYRRRGPSGGGWPATFEDAVSGIDALRGLEAEVALDLGRVDVVGHSAGATLAAWAVGRTAIRPTRIVALAGVLDLEAAADEGLGGNAVAGLLEGGPDDQPGRYAAASPRRLLPLSVPMTLVHGDADRHVPVAHSRAFAEAAAGAGDDVDLFEIPRADHFDLIDPRTAAGAKVVSLVTG